VSDTAPAGWYPDPRDPATEYWWDGTQYTQSRPIGSAAPAIPGAPAAYAPAPYAPAGYAPSGYAPANGVSPKSRTVAAILGFFLGGIGIHRFYLGNIGLGLGLLLAGWITLGIWPLIDWIFVLAGQARDGQGLLVVNWQ
jgi:TM2 domain-containing membrane protein YozV